MLVYKDRAFCPFYETCNKGKACFRALTEKVREEATLAGMLIDQFIKSPECFEEVKE